MASRVSARRPSYFSLLRQRKVAKRKACRSPGPCGLPCAAQPGHTAEEGTGSGSDFPSGVRVLLPLPLGEGWGEGSPAVIRWRVAQERPDKGRTCPKAAQRTSLCAPRAIRATQRARSKAQGQRIRLAFLLGTFLWRSKEKCLGRRAETRLATKEKTSRRNQSAPLCCKAHIPE